MPCSRIVGASWASRPIDGGRYEGSSGIFGGGHGNLPLEESSGATGGVSNGLSFCSEAALEDDDAAPRSPSPHTVGERKEL